ncbi:MAG TPA: MmcQ/YjbR family DNA-binding protein [Micromonosporaceae bacterium]|jgi:hypothetical protein
MPDADLLARVRRICLALPEVTERLSHGAPTWFVRDKSTFVNLWRDGHHDLEFPHLTVAAPPGAQQALIAGEPDRFFRPPYVGHRGWVGLRLDRPVDWAEVAELCEDAYRTVAPATLVRILDARSGQDRRS